MWRKDGPEGLAFNPHPVSSQQIDAVAEIQVHAIIENRKSDLHPGLKAGLFESGLKAEPIGAFEPGTRFKMKAHGCGNDGETRVLSPERLHGECWHTTSEPGQTLGFKEAPTAKVGYHRTKADVCDLRASFVFVAEGRLVHVFEDPSRTHASADAHGHHAVAGPPALEFTDDRGCEFRAGAAQRMSQCDGTAVGIDLLGIQS